MKIFELRLFWDAVLRQEVRIFGDEDIWEAVFEGGV